MGGGRPGSGGGGVMGVGGGGRSGGGRGSGGGGGGGGGWWWRLYYMAELKRASGKPPRMRPGRAHNVLALNLRNADEPNVNRLPWLPDCTRFRCPPTPARLLLSRGRDSPCGKTSWTHYMTAN